MAKTRKVNGITLSSTVPIPQPSNPYPFAEMKVGESFTVPKADVAYCRQAIQVYCRRFRGKEEYATVPDFTTKQEGEGIRVWRVEDKDNKGA